jgi:hypothetical protein
MASFDLETFLKVQQGTGTGLFESIGMAYGVPSCMLTLAQDVLSILPSSVLGGMKDNILDGKAKANEVTAAVFNKLMLDTGIMEFDTETGNIQFKSISSWMGKDNDDSQFMDNLGGLLGAAQYAASFGAQLYQNYQNIADEINAIGDCLDKFKTLKGFDAGNSASQKATLSPDAADDLFSSVYAGDKEQLDEALTFIQACDNQLDKMNNTLLARANDPSLEPCFLDSSELDVFLSGTTFKRCAAVDPGVVGDLQALGDEDDIFRLTYGPPLTSDGQYVLTSDGLYYDSQSGGLDPIYLAISGVVPPGEKWKYDYDPNLGGKGTSISIKSLNKFVDNLFDPDRLDDSLGMDYYYDEDHFLSVIMQQRDKQVYDLSSDLQTFITTYGEDSAIVNNQRQLIISEIANHNSKISRRKKQIEIAVKAPVVYGDASGPIFAPGDIPINDFTFLEHYNLEVDLEKQKALVFEEGEVTGMVLPIKPLFVKSSPKPPSIQYSHLNVPTIGKGSIIYNPSGNQAGTVLSLTDQIVSDHLFAIYNFLDTKVVTPSSTEYYLTNCATEDRYNNAQLNAASTRNVYFSGLSIPYLEGIVKNRSTAPTTTSGLGSFVRLPDSEEFRELTYNPSGFSMEFWVHIPNIMDGEAGWLSSTASSLTKCVLACENVGTMSGVSALDHTGAERGLDYLENKKGNEFVRGMVCGFTRDKRITQFSGAGNNNNGENDPVSSLSFFVAPTQARDFSSASWINNDECQDYATFYKMKVDLSANHGEIGSFGDVSSGFILVDVVADSSANEMRFYADGVLAATSALDKVWGVQSYGTPALPNFKQDNSFYYTASTVDAPTTLHDGPDLGPFFTPWIMGGGWTDGMYRYGNFLGGNLGGITSGLRGHLGSVKFYSRPLNNSEVAQNYKAQQGFFKQIITT